ncbi:hypothetical protein D3C80_1157810 [compost metagenome]
MIRQDFKLLNPVQGSDKTSKVKQIFFFIMNAGNIYVADPHFTVMIRQPAGQLQCTVIGFTGQLNMSFIIDVLQVQQDKIGNIQQIADLGAVIITVGIKSGVQIPALLYFCKQLLHEMRLQGRLTAGNG